MFNVISQQSDGVATEAPNWDFFAQCVSPCNGCAKSNTKFLCGIWGFGSFNLLDRPCNVHSNSFTILFTMSHISNYCNYVIERDLE